MEIKLILGPYKNKCDDDKSDRLYWKGKEGYNKWESPLPSPDKPCLTAVGHGERLLPATPGQRTGKYQ